MNMSAMRNCSTWNLPMGMPNCLRVCMGMTDELGVGHYVKRVTAADGLFGNADVHLMAIARSA